MKAQGAVSFPRSAGWTDVTRFHISSSLRWEGGIDVGDMSLIQAKRMFRVLHFKDISSTPEPAFAAHVHWVFHCVIPESQLSGVLARR
jgi:hypothetical protein